MKSRVIVTTGALAVILLSLFGNGLSAQSLGGEPVKNFKDRSGNSIVIDYNNPKTCIIAGINVEGVSDMFKDQVLSASGLAVGDTISIPGEKIFNATKKISARKLYSDVSFFLDSLVGEKAYITIELLARTRVSRWCYKGVRKMEQEELDEKVHLKPGRELSDYIIKLSSDLIKEYFKEKGFLNVEVTPEYKTDTLLGDAAIVTFVVDRKKRVRIQEIVIEGDRTVPDAKLLKAMKKTKDKRFRNFFSSKKFKEKEYKNDKKLLVEKFNEFGFRDAALLKDSVYVIDEKNIGIKFKVDEGKRYYFRNISWTGNSLYPEDFLNTILGIKKGDVYDVVTLQERLFGGQKEDANVSKLYKDVGYLFFNVSPVETAIVGDSIDVEIRLFEGKPATYNNIVINGNNVTSEKIVRRELFTRPGYLYSESELERSIRQIATMGHFDEEAITKYGSGFSVVPNSSNNTVDIIYNVTEKPNSQFEISGGWGGNTFVGSLGLSFNNFSMRRVFDKTAWRPVPLGDGQSLSLRFQTNGTYYMALSLGFTEPWLFRNKPTSLNTSLYYTRQTNSTYYYKTNDQYMEVYGLGVGLGTRLKWPDNWFVLYNELSLKRYQLKDWQYYFIFTDGSSNIIDYSVKLQRNSTDQPLYPRSGSDFSLGLQITPPYSLFRSKDTDYENMKASKRYQWIEYHKWTIGGTIYTKLIGDLVLMNKFNFGYLGYYNKKLGYSPFEGFMLGGDGMSGYNTYGAEIISMRGYDNYSLTPMDSEAYIGRVYDKYTIELRHPVILEPTSTIYALLFLEGGNCWDDMKSFNPFSIKRSAGAGLRIFLPMVGMLGIDWGYGFDRQYDGDKGGSNFHFVIGQQF